MLEVPVRPKCVACGGLIPAGTGLFIASVAGPKPEPTLEFVHSGGACPEKAGAVRGSGRIFGSIPELASVLWEGSSQVACDGGPLFLRARDAEEEEGWVVPDLLVLVLGALFAGLLLLPLIVGRF
jgi:hypothetical protein